MDEQECEFASVLEAPSALLRFDIAVPCGLVLEEVDGAVVVADTIEGSTSREAGIQQGDVRLP